MPFPASPGLQEVALQVTGWIPKESQGPVSDLSQPGEQVNKGREGTRALRLSGHVSVARALHILVTALGAWDEAWVTWATSLTSFCGFSTVERLLAPRF